MKRSTPLLSLLAASSLLLGGCETLQRTPKVDLAPAQPVRYAQQAPAAAAAVTVAPGGSLFQAVSYRPAFEDPRARMPGDTLTVQITERISATQKSSSSVDRTGSVSGGVSALPFVSPTSSLLGKLNVGANSANNFAGSGETENANTFTGSITTTVQEVLPNGHLLVVGEKQIGVNQNVDVLRFSGTVDPKQIRPGNTVASTQVANVRVESRGRGQQGEALSIGWLARFFLTVLPF
ncbi:MAG: flagellar basal body L-ring protein FlgH [Hydrogenophaga sp.]|jgi:flagellar L-ring protein precursor FlgH|uniref:flagellar basal body L-ring protein FlgH n=1 Tax=Hydrogenophaga sp. TaxID=1904254 RepID=UPI0025C49036|nr:flagellar basal body L-ring protein FlgH [Hydrogenophaga sp.]MBW0182519.1 flagellar basal body L-ring protein FlgH [Hydrogenophaga sp.]